MRQRTPLLAFALALLLCLSLAACGAKQYPMQITVVNRSTYPIADIRISLTTEEGESAGIDLGEYTEEQRNAGFHLQFYGADGQPVDPDYDPSSPTFLESGDFLILAPPDLSVTLFLDTAYDRETYDQKITELYDADGDGRGDPIPEESIPILTSGMPPFTHMQNLRSDSNADGTYHYTDITEDGQITVENLAEPSALVIDAQDLADYLPACALALSDSLTYNALTVQEDETYSETLGYPVYIITYTSGEGEDSRDWTVFATDTDTCTYLYAFCEAPEAAEDMEEIYQSIFAQLHWSDAE